VPAVRYSELTSLEKGEPSASIRKRILAVRKIQQERFKDDPGIYCNADIRASDLQKYCRLDEKSNQLLKNAINGLHFSARAYNRILKVSRTMADMGGREDIHSDDISEAVQYRTLDKQLWV
jgi:magnesium chelatase family protein